MSETPYTLARRKPDLADHFIACSKVGRHLTVFDESRLVIARGDSRGLRNRIRTERARFEIEGEAFVFHYFKAA